MGLKPSEHELHQPVAQRAQQLLIEKDNVELRNIITQIEEQINIFKLSTQYGDEGGRSSLDFIETPADRELIEKQIRQANLEIRKLESLRGLILGENLVWVSRRLRLLDMSPNGFIDNNHINAQIIFNIRIPWLRIVEEEKVFIQQFRRTITGLKTSQKHKSLALERVDFRLVVLQNFKEKIEILRNE